MLDIHHGDNLVILERLPDASFDLVYIDPPFNTGRQQKRTQLRTVRDEDGDRTGFAGKRYRSIQVGQRGFADAFDDYLAFLEPRLVHARRLLKPTGSFFLHIDCREAHYCKVLLDVLFGRDSFMNEIVWAYDYGGRSRSKWSQKHDTIFWYAADPARYTFRYDDIDRIPYMAPELVGPAKAARGKTPTDTWWNTIVSPNGKEKTGYPTQKPLAIVERIVRVHSNPGDRLLDFFAGSGTLGAAAAKFGRDAVLVDDNRQAISVMKKRFSGVEGVRWFEERRTKRTAASVAARGSVAKKPAGASPATRGAASKRGPRAARLPAKSRTPKLRA
jgi:site-specific DNA-methyltransferase (adenine-specific)